MERGRQGPDARGAGFATGLASLATVDAAVALLGALLTHRWAAGEKRAAVIVETEAYLGVTDPACHTFGGRRTARVLPMWGPPLRAYVYRVYGRNDCFNVVTGAEQVPEAVLVRAVVPLAAWTSGERGPGARVGSGPGRACRWMGITPAQSGLPLDRGSLRLLPGPARSHGFLRGARVGVGYAGEAAGWLLRFALAGCPAVTRPRALAPWTPAVAGVTARR